MSVSTSLPVALQYAANPGGTSLLLKLDTKSMRDRGAALTWLSAFPKEMELVVRAAPHCP